MSLILLLGLHGQKDKKAGAADYIRMMLQPADLSMCYDDKQRGNGREVQLIQRIFCTCIVCGINIQVCADELLDEMGRQKDGFAKDIRIRFLEDLKRGVDILRDARRKNSKYYSQATMIPILKYFANCKEKLSECIEKTEASAFGNELRELRTNYRNISRGEFFDENFYKAIHAYREKIEVNIKESGDNLYQRYTE